MTSPRNWILIGMALHLTALGCGPQASDNLNTPGLADTSCRPGQAQILVGDGSLKNLCGCTETAGEMVGVGAGPLNCSVAAGTIVFFLYHATVLQHQIVSTGTPAFISSAISDPKSLLTIHAHPAQFSAAGTYTYQDAFNLGLTGRIIVQ
jgi:plastocyanin